VTLKDGNISGAKVFEIIVVIRIAKSTNLYICLATIAAVADYRVVNVSAITLPRVSSWVRLLRYYYGFCPGLFMNWL